MKRAFLVALVVAILGLQVVPVAFAAPRLPIADAWTDASTTSYNTAALHVRSSVSGPNCSVTTTSYLKFDLSSVSATIATANLTMKYTYANVGAGNTTVQVLPVADDSWTETNVGTLKPTPGTTVLSQLTYPPSPTVGSSVTFPSTTELLGYLNTEANGDNIASIALRITGCTAGAPEVRFGSRENVGNEPGLELLGTTAVTLSSSDAQSLSWPLYAGLGAVALFVVVGVMISRRKTA